MPTEAKRLQHPAGARERRLAAALACAAALVVAAALVLHPGGSHAPRRRGCVVATVAGVMGAGTVQGCGMAAARVCREYAAGYEAVALQCAARRGRAVTAPATGAGRRPASGVRADPGARSGT